jgi:hypothetical protein
VGPASRLSVWGMIVTSFLFLFGQPDKQKRRRSPTCAGFRRLFAALKYIIVENVIFPGKSATRKKRNTQHRNNALYPYINGRIAENRLFFIFWARKTQQLASDFFLRKM